MLHESPSSNRQDSSRRVAKASEKPQDTRSAAAQRNRLRARASRGNSITLGSAHPCARCSFSIQISFLNTTLQKFFLKYLRYGLGLTGDKTGRSYVLLPSLISPLVNGAHVLPSRPSFKTSSLNKHGAVSGYSSIHARCTHSWFHPWRMAFPYLVFDLGRGLRSGAQIQQFMSAPFLGPRR